MIKIVKEQICDIKDCARRVDMPAVKGCFGHETRTLWPLLGFQPKPRDGPQNEGKKIHTSCIPDHPLLFTGSVSKTSS